jgi:hypothetical protein
MEKHAIVPLWLVSIVCLCLFLPFTAKSQVMEESISATSFEAIQVAVAELERNKLDVADYRITVQQSDSSIVVLFGNLNSPKGQRGSSGPRPAFSVELSRAGLKVIRSQFVR